ncbi:hypothetical protein GCM10011320_54320 [Neoroseomonas lacus]|uniref:Uncharacterized protein n=1 Tax=Neoroseomonas lacus TaxID=287609 RepID=A0A917NY43_9PROT|nr:hypothetical protein GCM10011320_54320 [Neoroseomonas lacus]
MLVRVTQQPQCGKAGRVGQGGEEFDGIVHGGGASVHPHIRIYELRLSIRASMRQASQDRRLPSSRSDDAMEMIRGRGGNQDTRADRGRGGGSWDRALTARQAWDPLDQTLSHHRIFPLMHRPSRYIWKV